MGKRNKYFNWHSINGFDLLGRRLIGSADRTIAPPRTCPAKTASPPPIRRFSSACLYPQLGWSFRLIAHTAVGSD